MNIRIPAYLFNKSNRKREICPLCASEEFLLHGFSNRLSPVHLSFVWAWMAPELCREKS